MEFTSTSFVSLLSNYILEISSGRFVRPLDFWFIRSRDDEMCGNLEPRTFRFLLLRRNRTEEMKTYISFLVSEYETPVFISENILSPLTLVHIRVNIKKSKFRSPSLIRHTHWKWTLIMKDHWNTWYSP